MIELYTGISDVAQLVGNLRGSVMHRCALWGNWEQRAPR